MVFVIKEENFSLGIKATEGKYDVSKKTAQKFQRASTSTPDFAISSSHSQKKICSDLSGLRLYSTHYIPLRPLQHPQVLRGGDDHPL